MKGAIFTARVVTELMENAHIIREYFDNNEFNIFVIFSILPTFYECHQEGAEVDDGYVQKISSYWNVFGEIPINTRYSPFCTCVCSFVFMYNVYIPAWLFCALVLRALCAPKTSLYHFSTLHRNLWIFSWKTVLSSNILEQT